MSYTFSIQFARAYAAKLNSSDPKEIKEGLRYFCNHQHTAAAISRLPDIAKLLDHTDQEVRNLSMNTFNSVSWQDPTLIRPYVPAIAARLGNENDEYTRMLILTTLEPVAKEDDVVLLAGCIEPVAGELKGWRNKYAARVLRAVNKRAPNLIGELSETSRQLLTRNRIGVSRKRTAPKPKGTDLVS